MRQAVPAFITLVVMPLTYSIAYGVIAGVCSYIFLYLINFGIDMIEVAFGRKSREEVLYENTPDAFQVGVVKDAIREGRGAIRDGRGWQRRLAKL